MVWVGFMLFERGMCSVLTEDFSLFCTHNSRGKVFLYKLSIAQVMRPDTHELQYQQSLVLH